jgi:hemerythrin-like metal-binding protein
MTIPPGHFSWRARYATNIPTIDAHHQGLFKILRMLQESTYESRGDVEVGVVLDHLQQQSLAHFEVEEALMRRTGFPEIDLHTRDHGRFVEQLRHLKARLDQGEAGVPTEVISVLYEWLHDHILLQDMVFAEHVRTQSKD